MVHLNYHLMKETQVHSRIAMKVISKANCIIYHLIIPVSFGYFLSHSKHLKIILLSLKSSILPWILLNFAALWHFNLLKFIMGIWILPPIFKITYQTLWILFFYLKIKAHQIVYFLATDKDTTFHLFSAIIFIIDTRISTWCCLIPLYHNP